MYMKLFGFKITFKNILIAVCLMILGCLLCCSKIFSNIETMNEINQNPKMTMLDDSNFKPECCPSLYSSSKGCACISGKIQKTLEQRGGNKLQCV